jgi:DNA invertase Pin-like site-specific DNA recombinase
MAEAVYYGYFRVSTAKQGLSGLGLAAQQMAVHGFVKGTLGHLAGEFTEVESGRRNDRPQLLAALELCRKRRAILVIAKLDRLARNVAFISALLESRVQFVAVDMPEADVTFLQMAAVFAEWEARKISERTKAALAAAKARGTLLGWANPDRAGQHAAASTRGAQANKQMAERFASNVYPIIQSIQEAGCSSLAPIADALNARGVRTQRGGRWHPNTVNDIIHRHAQVPSVTFALTT